ncbi:MAG: VTT domain-containing protein [Burkholderiales bacterium]|nr:VTT domain-containing protein [Burkholderiales bacterium]
MKPGNAARVGLALVLAAGLVLGYANRTALSADALSAWLAEVGAWAPLAFIALYAAATVMFLPGSVLTLAAGALFGAVPGALYSLTGATLGATLAFLVARYLAADWVARRAGGRLKQLIEGVEAEGWRFVAFVRLVPLFPFNLVNYALGLTRIPLFAYAAASFVCMFPGALAYAWLGHAGRESLTGEAGAIRNALFALALLALVAFLPRLVRQYRQAGIRWIDSGSLKGSLEQSDRPLLVDVRTADDFVGPLGHIPGARNIPLEELSAHLAQLEPSKQHPLMLICRTQKRSLTAAHQLKQAGFTDVWILRGGMEQWNKEGYAIARESGL